MIPAWLQQAFQQKPPVNFMGKPDFSGMGASAPLSAGFQGQGPQMMAPQPQGPQTMGQPAGFAPEAMENRFPAAYGKPPMNWAGLAGSLGGLLGEQQAEQQPQAPAYMPPAAVPLGEMMPSLFDLMRARGYGNG